MALAFLVPLQVMWASSTAAVWVTTLVSQPVAALSRWGGMLDSTSSLLMHICTVTGCAAGIFMPDFFACSASLGDSATSVLEVTFHSPTLPCAASAGLETSNAAAAPHRQCRKIITRPRKFARTLALPRRARHAVHDQPPRLGGIAPAGDLHPFARLKVLVVGEEMLDLLDGDVGKVAVTGDAVETGGDMGAGDGDDLLVLAFIVLHLQDAYGLDADHRAGRDGAAVGDQHI